MKKTLIGKIFMLGLSLQLLMLPFYSSGIAASFTNEKIPDGFVIEADRVVGSGMVASITRQETSSASGELMLRFYYKTATIYGMKLTKQILTATGTVSITMKANGPVTMKGMTVDATAISFQGACIKAESPLPEAGIEKVVMVAHYMNTEEGDLQQLTLDTVSGKVGTNVPRTAKILEDLGKLPSNLLGEEMNKISKGHLPLACEDGSGGGQTGSSSLIGNIDVGSSPIGADGLINPVLTAVGQGNSPLLPGTEIIDPVSKPILNTVGQVISPTNPIPDVIDTITNPESPVTQVLNPVVDSVTKPVLSTVSQVTNPVADTVVQVTKPVLNNQAPASGALPTAQSLCSQLSAANGIINKELALGLIDQAITDKVTLTDVCKNNPTQTALLKNWQEGVLSSLGLTKLLGSLLATKPQDQLLKMRDKIIKDPAGTIEYKP